MIRFQRLGSGPGKGCQLIRCPKGLESAVRETSGPGKHYGVCHVPGLVNVYIAMERSTMLFMGKLPAISTGPWLQ